MRRCCGQIKSSSANPPVQEYSRTAHESLESRKLLAVAAFGGSLEVGESRSVYELFESPAQFFNIEDLNASSTSAQLRIESNDRDVPANTTLNLNSQSPILGTVVIVAGSEPGTNEFRVKEATSDEWVTFSVETTAPSVETAPPVETAPLLATFASAPVVAATTAQTSSLTASDAMIALEAEKPLSEILGGDALQTGPNFDLEFVSGDEGILDIKLGTRSRTVETGFQATITPEGTGGQAALDKVSFMAMATPGVVNFQVRVGGANPGEWIPFAITIGEGGGDGSGGDGDGNDSGDEARELAREIERLRLQYRGELPQELRREIRDEIMQKRAELASLLPPPRPISPIAQSKGPIVVVTRTNVEAGKTVEARAVFDTDPPLSAEYFIIENVGGSSGNGIFIFRGETLLPGRSENVPSLELGELVFQAAQQKAEAVFRVTAVSSIGIRGESVTLRLNSTAPSSDVTADDLTEDFTRISSSLSDKLSELGTGTTGEGSNTQQFFTPINIGSVYPLREQAGHTNLLDAFEENVDQLFSDIEEENLVGLGIESAAEQLTQTIDSLIVGARAQASEMGTLLRLGDSDAARFLNDWRFNQREFINRMNKLNTLGSRILRYLDNFGKALSGAQALKDYADANTAGDPNADLKLAIDLAFARAKYPPVVLFDALGGRQDIKDLIDAIAHLKGLLEDS